MRQASFGLLFLVALLAVGSVLAGDAKEAAIKKERKKFEGTWRVVALEVDGNKAPEEDARKLSVVNKADGTWALVIDGEERHKGTSTIDPTAKPKTIDFKITAGNDVGKEFVGIYEIAENTRKMCFTEKDKTRPADFSTQAGSGHILVMFEREKK